MTADSSEAAFSKLQLSFSALSVEWEGLSHEHVFREWQVCHAQARQTIQLLSDIAMQFQAIAARFEAADQG